MTAKQKDEKSIFKAALELKTQPERMAYIEKTCASDPAQKERILALLKAREQKGDFLEELLDEPANSFEEQTQEEQPGSIIGRYKLLEQIGEGGMAVVYMAEQEKPIRRKVALKIIKLGMDTKSVIARFEAERQALAMMDHPNIAKVLDAGATETGRPYFVMELVKGASITDFCDANNLSTHERLNLFVLVCQAVQHAHQKGIIHRDIKPTNVMVTLHDGVPIPKVIDFGIAKAINCQLTEKTLFTRYAQIIGTPAYMSPEQAELSGLDIDIRTDVYSLGTLLYELLTGSPPFDSEYLLSKSYEEMQRIIQEEEPIKPSTRIRTATREHLSVGAGPCACPTSGGQAGPPLRKIHDDLDWIVMKTIEKDRDRRYDSVGEFSSDIKRYLNNEAVLAGPPSAFYRIRKLVRRHRVLVTAGTAIAISIILGLIISASLYLKMRRALNTVVQLENKVEIDSKLSTAQRLYAEGRYKAALNEIDAVLDVEKPEPKAQLLKARILIEFEQPKKAETHLLLLTKSKPAIAGTAYSLLSQINIGIDDEKADEYEALAASILPETAEAYSLRAMTSRNPQVALQWLDRAISLDPSHYPSYKARALLYYSLFEDEKMGEDVGILIALRPADSLGYALRAVLRRESGQFEKAIMDQTRAIKLCESETERIELYRQRYETYTTIGNYSAALADARYCAELEPLTYVHPYHIFCALAKMKDFTEAKREYRSIIQTNHEWTFRFNQIVGEYVYDAFSKDESLDIPPDMISQAPFAHMKRVERCFQILKNKATLLEQQRQGLLLRDLSPDGKELLCGWSALSGGMTQTVRKTALSVVPKKWGLKIIDIESGRERYITSSYRGSAAWSPDGQNIAFVDPNYYICIVPSEGGQARRLVLGTYPQWSQNSRYLYYITNGNGGDVCSINIYDTDLVPKKLISCPGQFVINEKENWIAFEKSTGIDIVDITSGIVLYQFHCPWPLKMWGLSLSPDGRELCFRTWWASTNIGPLIFDTQEKKLYRVLDYPVDTLLRSQDGSRLVIGTRPKAWIMDVDPNIPICHALGEKLPGNNLIADLIKTKSQAISADPQFPELYLERALAYRSVGQYEQAEADMQQFDQLITERDHHIGLRIFQWMRRYYASQHYETAKYLAPYAEKLMDRFPEEVSSYQNVIKEIIDETKSTGKPEIAERWRVKLQEVKGR